ncbi:MAG: L,D-transpeptidase [Gammaproteobacteria bacterium]|nr:L,D-transpeptidase [Gammaproteobacteria bacterium]
MLKRTWMFAGVICLSLLVTACMKDDPSTYLADDTGKVYHTLYYLKDKRGQSHFPITMRPTGQKLFIFDPKALSWAAYDAKGERVMTGRGSGGADFCEDMSESCRTVTGSFRVYKKRGEDCTSGEYPVKTQGGARMPYCMYFYRGYTIHAGYNFSENTSHGCIRVLPSAAKWLNESFITIGTRVVVLPYADES